MLLELTKSMLEIIGYTVHACPNGQVAIDSFCREPERFDLVITDHGMPDMNGIVMMHKLRAMRPDLPVIYITGSYDVAQELQLSGDANGAVVLKPYNVGEIEAVLKTFSASA